MDRAERRRESERLRAVLLHIRDDLDALIGHLEEDVLPPRMVAASAQHLMSIYTADVAFAQVSPPLPSIAAPIFTPRRRS